MAGPAGLQMLLKAMGIDFTPEQVVAVITQLQTTVQNVDARLTRIEQKLDAVRYGMTVEKAAESASPIKSLPELTNDFERQMSGGSNGRANDYDSNNPAR